MSDLAITSIVLFAAVLHATWNALIKSSQDRLLALTTLISTGGILAAIPLPFLAPPEPESWPFLCTSVLLHLGYYVFLLRAYEHGDLSFAYPIARGTGPLLVAVLSGPIVGEYLSGREVGGVLVVCFGIGLLAFRTGGGGNPNLRHALGFALGTGAFIASYTLADGLGVRVSGHPLSYILWTNAIEAPPMLLAAWIWRRGRITNYLRAEGIKSSMGGVVAALSYGMVMYMYSFGAIAPIAALRETSVVLAAWIGTRLLGEPFGRRRVLAAAAVAAGIVLLNL